MHFLKCGAPQFVLRSASHALLWVVLLMTTATALHAQLNLPRLGDTAVPRKRVYGIGLDEFFIAARNGTGTTSGRTYAQLWELAREMNVSTWEIVNESQEMIDYLRDSALQGERIIPNIQPIGTGGHGREIVFYPFDSAQSYYWQNVFRHKTAGKCQTVTHL